MNNIPMEDIEQLLKHAVLKRETLKKADNTTVPAYHISIIRNIKLSDSYGDFHVFHYEKQSGKEF